MKKFATIIVAALAVASLSACGDQPGPDGIVGESSTPPVKTATNVEMFKVPGSQGFSDGVIVFDIERDGQTLTCTTKQNYNSGVGCVVKAPQ
jgi:hypothetical protein